MQEKQLTCSSVMSVTRSQAVYIYQVLGLGRIENQFNMSLRALNASQGGEMKPEIYLEAAKRIINRSERMKLLDSANSRHNICCCDAIFNAALGDSGQAKRDFADVFRSAACTYWWANPFLSDEDQEARRLALLFMYWIAKDGL